MLSIMAQLPPKFTCEHRIDASVLRLAKPSNKRSLVTIGIPRRAATIAGGLPLAYSDRRYLAGCWITRSRFLRVPPLRSVLNDLTIRFNFAIEPAAAIGA